MEIEYLQQTMQTVVREPTNMPPVNPAHLKASINEMIDINVSTEEGHLHLRTNRLVK
jgi:hypothetical protein